MEDLLVLGIIPHTNIQIDFVAWVILTQALLFSVLFSKLLQHKIHAFYITIVERQALQLLEQPHYDLPIRRRLA